jgi:hypothetical protein
MKPPIASSKLAENLQQAAAIKAEMTRLLRELESKATTRQVEKPGGWRHHPEKWATEHVT